MDLTPNILLTLAGLTLTFYALFAKMLIKFNDRYSRNLLYFLLVNIVSTGFTVVLVLTSIQGVKQDLIYPIEILDVSWASSLIIVIIFAFVLLNRELSEIENPEERKRRQKRVILIIIFAFVLFLIMPLILDLTP